LKPNTTLGNGASFAKFFVQNPRHAGRFHLPDLLHHRRDQARDPLHRRAAPTPDRILGATQIPAPPAREQSMVFAHGDAVKADFLETEAENSKTSKTLSVWGVEGFLGVAQAV